MQNYKLKLVKNRNKEGSGAPQFSLSYSPENRKSNLNFSYDIISLLKEDNDIIVEIDTSLVIQTEKSNKFSLDEFISEIKKMNLEFSFKKIESRKQSFFSFLITPKKTREDHVITVYVPDSVWKDEAFKKILPDCEVKYYIKKNTDEPRKVLDGMSFLMENEINNHFIYVIFDAVSFNQMGISSSHYEFKEIKKILGIV